MARPYFTQILLSVLLQRLEFGFCNVLFFLILLSTLQLGVGTFPANTHDFHGKLWIEIMDTQTLFELAWIQPQLPKLKLIKYVCALLTSKNSRHDAGECKVTESV